LQDTFSGTHSSQSSPRSKALVFAKLSSRNFSSSLPHYPPSVNTLVVVIFVLFKEHHIDEETCTQQYSLHLYIKIFREGDGKVVGLGNTLFHEATVLLSNGPNWGIPCRGVNIKVKVTCATGAWTDTADTWVEGNEGIINVRNMSSA